VKHYFVTGATGVVGSSLVPVLLRDPEARLSLLVRAGSAGELSARLEALHLFWGVAPGDTAVRSRVEALAGDTTLPRLGLDEQAHRALASNCTHIVHAAGLVRMNLPLEEARRSAVGAAHNVVALARACTALRKLDFVSTVGVGGRLPQAIPERWLTEPRGFHNTYEQAKAEAEDFLREETARQPLPLTVHRPSMVVGDTRDGRIIGFQVFYFLCEFLSGRRTFGLYPDFGDARLDIIGCDIVAEAIAGASADPQTIGRVLHLCSGPQDALRIEELKHAVRLAFAARGIAVPGDRVLPRRWYARLARFGAMLAPPDLRKALSTLPIYLDYLADTQAFDDTGFRGWLAAQGRSRPAPAGYVTRVLDYYLDARHADRTDRG
jgi:thioester reductase-like protein